MGDLPKAIDLEERLKRLEEIVGAGGPGGQPERPRLHPLWPFVLGLAAAALGYVGLGYPQHYYQVLFSVLLLLLLYHRGFLLRARGTWKWPQIVLNLVLFCLFFKLLIGGGIGHPFDWLKMPAITKVPPSGDQSWYSRALPDLTVQWQAIPKVSDWSVDVTKIQTMLLIAILAGALFRFEPFTSITALALLLISLPSYLQFDWDRVILFLIVGSVSIYLQARVAGPPRYP